ncbi:MAG TPA: hypothetical protein DEA08_10055 [Planctomycetes bacterium]|nr:hypothetical protein [Planctomycetota bacterium]
MRLELAHGLDDFEEVDRHYRALAERDPEGQVEALYAESLLRRGRPRAALKRFEALASKGLAWSTYAQLKSELLRQGVVARDPLRSLKLLSLQRVDAVVLMCLRSLHDRVRDPRTKAAIQSALSSAPCLFGNANGAATALGSLSRDRPRHRAGEVYRALRHSNSVYPAVLFLEELCYEHLLWQSKLEVALETGRHMLAIARRKDDTHPQLQVVAGLFADTPPEARAHFAKALELEPQALLPAGLDAFLVKRFGEQAGRELAAVFEPLPPAHQRR